MVRRGGRAPQGRVARDHRVVAERDGPNVALVIRFEREGEERFARWIGGEDWHGSAALDRLLGCWSLGGSPFTIA